MAERSVGPRHRRGRGLRPSQSLLEKAIVVREKEAPPPRWHLRCPHCEQFTLVVVGRLKPTVSSKRPTGGLVVE